MTYDLSLDTPKADRQQVSTQFWPQSSTMKKVKQQLLLRVFVSTNHRLTIVCQTSQINLNNRISFCRKVTKLRLLCFHHHLSTVGDSQIHFLYRFTVNLVKDGTKGAEPGMFNLVLFNISTFLTDFTEQLMKNIRFCDDTFSCFSELEYKM